MCFGENQAGVGAMGIQAGRLPQAGGHWVKVDYFRISASLVAEVSIAALFLRKVLANSGHGITLVW